MQEEGDGDGRVMTAFHTLRSTGIQGVWIHSPHWYPHVYHRSFLVSNWIGAVARQLKVEMALGDGVYLRIEDGRVVLSMDAS